MYASFRALRRDGAAVHVEVFGGRTEYGGKTAIIGTLLDVTQQKQAEESLRQLPGLLLQSQDHERRRVARELHDSTAQILAALSLNLAALAEALPDAPVRVARLLAESQLLLEEASQQIRTRTYLLHPPLLEAAGLATAIRDYAIGFSKRSGIHVKLDLPEDWQRLDADEELALFRVVQEGLSNIHRHAKSPSARVRLTRDGQEIFLEIRDAGAGMTPEMLDRVRGLAGALGVGIAGMRERLHQLGGTLEIDSDAKGTRLHARMTVGKKHPHAR